MRSWLNLFSRRRKHHEIIAAILFPRAFVVAIGKWLVFAVAQSIHATRFNPKADEFLAAGQRAAFAERAIVFLRAAFVAIAFDANRDFGVALHVFSHGGELRFITSGNCGTVVGKVDGVFLQNLRMRRPVGVARFGRKRD